MGTQIDLHIVAKDIDDLKRQIKQAYESLGLATEAPVAEKKAPVAKKEAPKPVEQKKPAIDKKRKKAKPSERSCRECGTSSTPQWRDTKHPDGPACNACYFRLKNEASKKAVQGDKADEPKKSVKPKKTRNQQIRENLKIPKKEKKAEPVKESVSVPKVEIPLEVGGFLTWCETNVPSEMIRSKAFITGSNLVETWYNTIRANDSFIQWYTENGELYITAVRKVFRLFVARMPTTFLIQDTGDNVVLVATSPNKLKAKALQEIGDEVSYAIRFEG